MTYNLPKWPALVVAGEPITTDQAAELLVRTCGSAPSSNAHAFDAAACGIMGLYYHDWGASTEERDFKTHWAMLEAQRKSLGLLELEYLTNDRITSAWVGGPKGWCAWDGTIGCRNYNIGKWPSAAEVLVEWQRIAAAFPYLNLTAQLWSGETCEAGVVPVVEYRVLDGVVTMQTPGADLGRPTDTVDFGTLWSRPTELREVGCTLGQLAHGVALARAAVNSEA